VTVYLVGAGPGDPKLITVRGAELLASADVVIYDRLTAANLLDTAPPSAELIYVGKDPHGESVPQDNINDLLVSHGRVGHSVVRLKGGDPFVFARGAEEAAVLSAAGVDYEVVPGITSAFAAPAYAGIPVTMRYSSTSVTVVTGHEDPTKDRPDVDWRAIANLRGTIVIMMGVGRWPEISKQLMEEGLPPDTPAAAVRWGSTNRQATTRGTLATLGQSDLAAPSVIVVGEVASESLDWFERRPLIGQRVVVARSKDQAGDLAAKLSAAGAEVLAIPTIEIADASDGGAALRSAAERLGDYDWLVLTSPNGAQRFCDLLNDARDLAGVKIAVVGPGTADVLAKYGLKADLVPNRHVGEGLVEEFPVAESGGRVLIPRAAVARDVVPDGLVEAGWNVDVVEAYQTIAASIDSDSAELVRGATAICFTSSSTAANYVAAFGAESLPPVVVAIGPITAAELKSHGVAVNSVADPHTLDNLVLALREVVQARHSQEEG